MKSMLFIPEVHEVHAIPEAHVVCAVPKAHVAHVAFVGLALHKAPVPRI